jgi:hypothetical protein
MRKTFVIGLVAGIIVVGLLIYTGNGHWLLGAKG